MPTLKKHAPASVQLLLTGILCTLPVWATECPDPLNLSTDGTLSETCKLASSELSTLENTGVVKACETVCAQSYMITVNGSSQEKYYILLTNQTLVDATLKLRAQSSGLSPFVENEATFRLPAQSAYYVYSGEPSGASTPNLAVTYEYIPGIIGATHDSSVLYELPWTQGESRQLITDPSDNIYQFALPSGSRVFAARNGKVVGVKDRENRQDFSTTNNHAANRILIEHDDHSIAIYDNLIQNGSVVSLGDYVNKGDLLGYSGQTGAALNPMLTFRVSTGSSTFGTPTEVPVTFIAENGIYTSLAQGAYYTAVHENQVTDPDLSFEEGEDPALNQDGSVSFTPPVSEESIKAVQQAYVSYYGRPGDPAGVQYWAEILDANNGDLSMIIEDFGYSEEYQRRFGALTTTELVNNLYVQMFGREAEIGGLQWWSEEISAGRTTLANAALNIAAGAQNDDAATLEARVALAQRLTNAIEDLNIQYTEDDIPALKTVIANTTAGTIVENIELSGVLQEISSN